jgi:hypothetical protein
VFGDSSIRLWGRKIKFVLHSFNWSSTKQSTHHFKI